MKAFRGPKGKIVRRFGINIFENPKYDRLLEKRSTPPGMHGLKRKRSKLSEYGKQLSEKQKVKFSYGLTEKQFRLTYKKADLKKGPTGINLLQFLERRLDNVVFRAGFANSRAQSRQAVKHSHFLVNGKKVNIPSFLVKPDDSITVKNKESSRKMLSNFVSETTWNEPPSWISVDKNTLKIIFVRVPENEEIPRIADEQLIVELYSK